jgi:hypothetical protein
MHYRKTGASAGDNLRLMDAAPPGQYFDAPLAAMVAAREDGLIEQAAFS